MKRKENTESPNPIAVERRPIGRPRKHKPQIEEAEPIQEPVEFEPPELSDEEWNSTKKKKKSKKRTCPICNNTFGHNGYYMHINKCRKFKGI